MPHRQYYHRPTLKRDAIIVVVFNVIMYVIFSQYDVFEALYQYTRTHEAFELDEIIVLGASLATSLLVFGYRRIVELGQLAQAFERMSMHDPLTHLLNRRCGQIKLLAWHKQAVESGHGFSLLQLDLDNFKKINDLYGSSIGDEVLLKTANILKQKAPINSDVIRWVDDNFLILIPMTEKSPFDVANSLRETIETELLTAAVPITASVGVTIWHPNNSVDDLLHNAEEALLIAKHSGKNKVKGH